MGRTIEFSSDWPGLLFYAVQLVGLSFVLLFVALPLEGPSTFCSRSCSRC